MCATCATGPSTRPASSGCTRRHLVHRTSGIWQTVWLEAVPAVHVDAPDLVLHLADGSVEMTVHARRDGLARGAASGRPIRECRRGGGY